MDAKAETPIFWPPIQRDNSLEKTLMLEKIEGRKRRGRQKIRWLDGIINSTDMNLNKLLKIVKDSEACHGESMGSQRVSSSHQVAKVLEFQLQHQSFQ